MDIAPGVKIIRQALYFSKQKALVFGDTHIGYEEALNKQGILMPRLHLKEILAALDSVFEELGQKKPELIVLLGDVKHEFGTISRQEWQDTLRLIDYLTAKAKLVILKGNHDTILGPIADKKNVEVRKSLLLGDFLFCHGDKLLDEKSAEYRKAKTIVIGHEHPAISIRDGVRVEKYKCFLLGKYKRKALVVLPSFNFITEGTDVLQQKLLSPFIKDVSCFKVFVAADKAYDFGLVKKIVRMNEATDPR